MVRLNEALIDLYMSDIQGKCIFKLFKILQFLSTDIFKQLLYTIE